MIAEEIFLKAVEKETAAEREAYLDGACGNDANLRAEVEALLASDEEAGSFLEQPLFDEAGDTIDHPPLSERSGSMIGPYKLLEQIGEGGFGVVFMAEQQSPIVRKVALKIIKPGMDTKEVIARFEAERQALALMDHPNIAKVFDAGATELGRPFFVMELVRGIPITEFCDQNGLTTRQRLQLFAMVCQAVQHAHQKGIIHRDLKPSNVLVTMHDDQAVPKVIDFGVAKATSTRLTERTLFTRFAQMIGTPLYMSPEQAQMSGIDVDTRSDIYSLGVLLYELLTGTTPFDQTRVRDAAYDELLRIIREEDPPRPSLRISTLGDTLPSVASHRKIDPSKFSALIRGELDWIVMKAIEKNRNRRYDSAAGFGQDIQRYLDDEPVQACPPSTRYKMRKFIQRNKGAVAAACALTITLMGGIVGTSTGLFMLSNTLDELNQKHSELVRAERMKEEALQKQAEAAYREAVVAVLAGEDAKAQAALAIAGTRISQTRINIVEGLLAINDGRNDDAKRHAQRALADLSPSNDSDRIATHSLLAIANCYAGYDDVAFEHLAELRKLQPHVDLDALFLAYASLVDDYGRSLRLLKEHPDIKGSTAGLLIRALARIMSGNNQQDAAILDDAISDTVYLRLLLKENRCSQGCYVLALASAIELARVEGRDDAVRAYAALGAPIATQLQKLSSVPGTDYDLWLFYRAVEQEQLAADAINRVGTHPGTYSFFLAADCLQRSGPQNALKRFEARVDQRDSTYVRLAMAHLVRDTDNGEQRVHDLVQGCLYAPSPFLRRFALLAMCLVSSEEDLKRIAEEGLRKYSPKVHATADSWGDTQCLEFLAGRITKEQLLAKCDQGFSETTAHFTIAMKSIARKDREMAKQHFDLCVATNRIGIFDYEWARAYAARMEDDSWSKWFELSSQETSGTAESPKP